MKRHVNVTHPHPPTHFIQVHNKLIRENYSEKSRNVKYTHKRVGIDHRGSGQLCGYGHYRNTDVS